MHQGDRIFILFFLIIFFFFGYQEINAETINSISDSTSAITISENSHTEGHLPSVFMVIPFVILLSMIATGPLFYHHFWENNYPKIAIILGLITVILLFIFFK